MRLSLASDSSGARKAPSSARDSVAFVETGSFTNGNGPGRPRMARTASATRAGST